MRLQRFDGGQVNHAGSDDKNAYMNHHRIFFRQDVFFDLRSIDFSQGKQEHEKEEFDMNPFCLGKYAGFDGQDNAGNQGYRQDGVIDELMDANLYIADASHLLRGFQPQSEDD